VLHPVFGSPAGPLLESFLDGVVEKPRPGRGQVVLRGDEAQAGLDKFFGEVLKGLREDRG
jgi:hypothetical protein